MRLYESYLEEIEERKAMGLHPKPIDNELLTSELISQIKDSDSKHREDSLKYFTSFSTQLSVKDNLLLNNISIYYDENFGIWV